jgi:hypothetical protein
MRKRKNRVKRESLPDGVLDFETDPFKHGREPKPFAACVLFPEKAPVFFWDSRHAARRVADYIGTLPKCTLWAHNGGKFDFHFLLRYAEPGLIEYRNGRVVKFKIGRVTLRDSYPLIPVPLAAYKKTVIDYRLFEQEKRDKHKQKILDYLFDDCHDLLELLTGFRAIVGQDIYTVGAAAFRAIKDLGYRIENGNAAHDSKFRPWFFGGRVEARQIGEFKGPWEYVDINSAYPFAMMHEHPHGFNYAHGYELPTEAGPWFARATFISKGALPVRAEDGVLFYPDDDYAREYYATGWEIVAGLETGTLKILEVMEVWEPTKTRKFDRFVEKFWKERQAAKKRKDKIAEIAYKLVLNSGYGKWAQNPEHFKMYRISEIGTDPGEPWDFCDDIGGDVSLWEKQAPQGDWGYYDVAVAASVTGFVRAMLWRAMCASDQVIYCDTDSMLAQSANVPLGDKLGQWKLVGAAKNAAIAGKKLYTLDMLDGETLTASKGAQLTSHEVKRVSHGEMVTWKSEAPAFHPTTGARFTIREIRQKTAKNGKKRKT